ALLCAQMFRQAFGARDVTDAKNALVYGLVSFSQFTSTPKHVIQAAIDRTRAIALGLLVGLVIPQIFQPQLPLSSDGTMCQKPIPQIFQLVQHVERTFPPSGDWP